MPAKKADIRLKVLKHVADMIQLLYPYNEEMTEEELEVQYNEAEEWADLLLESMGFDITDTTDELIPATCKLEDIEPFLEAKSEEYVVAEDL